MKRSRKQQEKNDMSTFLTPKELSERYRGTITERTLANWRYSGEGPRATKAGGRVLYALADVEDWERKRTTGGGKRV